MGAADFTALTDGLDVASLDRGVTTGVARPSGGGSFVFGFNSLVTSEGAAGYFTNQSNFAPTAALKGGSITGAIKRGLSGGDINFAPLLYLCLQGSSVNDKGYLLGLQDDEPYRITLRKGTIITGIPNASPGTSGILRRSTATYARDTWLHLRLDAVVNLNGDVILKAYASDLGAHAVTSPTWVAVPGMEDPALVASHGAGTVFVDDSLGVNSGSAALTAGRMGFAMYTKDVSRRGYFDHLTCARQL